MSTVPGRRILRRSTTAGRRRWFGGVARAWGWAVGRLPDAQTWTFEVAGPRRAALPLAVVPEIPEEAVDELEPGHRVGDFVVEALLARGGMSAVYRVRHGVLGSRYALKVLDRGLLARHRRRQRWQLCARLRREGRIQSRLEHPNLLRIHDLLDLEGTPALVMDHVDGPTLEALIDAGGLGVGDIDTLAEGMMAGLAVAHAAGVIHRDLKPANVLVASVEGGWVPRIADFGIAKEASDPSSPIGMDVDLTRTGQVLGTPGYMAPEQTQDAKGVGSDADVFAMGIVLFELVTGERLADDADRADDEVIAQRLPRLAAIDVPARMRVAITGALERRIVDVVGLQTAWRGDDVSPLVPQGQTDPRIWVTVGWAVGTVGTLAGLGVGPMLIRWLW